MILRRTGAVAHKALWGPATLTVGREEQIVGALTFDGALHMTHASHQIVPGLLVKAAQILAWASSGTEPA